MIDNDRSFEISLLIVLLILVAVFAFWVVPASVIDPPGFGYAQGLPPSTTINLVAILMAVTLVGRLWQIWRHSDRGTETESPAENPTSSAIDKNNEDVPAPRSRAIVIIFLCLIFPFLLIHYLGFYLSSFVFVGCFTIFLGERRTAIILGLPLILIAGIYAAFELGFVIELPRGVIIQSISATIGS